MNKMRILAVAILVILILSSVLKAEEFKWDGKTPTIKVYGIESYVYLPPNQNKGYQQTKSGYTIYFPENDFVKAIPLLLADPKKPITVTLVKKEKR